MIMLGSLPGRINSLLPISSGCPALCSLRATSWPCCTCTGALLCWSDKNASLCGWCVKLGRGRKALFKKVWHLNSICHYSGKYCIYQDTCKLWVCLPKNCIMCLYRAICTIQCHSIYRCLWNGTWWDMVACCEGVTMGMSGLCFVAWEEVEGRMCWTLHCNRYYIIAQAL